LHRCCLKRTGLPPPPSPAPLPPPPLHSRWRRQRRGHRAAVFNQVGSRGCGVERRAVPLSICSGLLRWRWCCSRCACVHSLGTCVCSLWVRLHAKSNPRLQNHRKNGLVDCSSFRAHARACVCRVCVCVYVLSKPEAPSVLTWLWYEISHLRLATSRGVVLSYRTTLNPQYTSLTPTFRQQLCK